ncbi:GM21233, partial protein [Babesia caballi]|uniref:GM21233, partial protein n=1 Tax=Babesia caballi TaxID=5871 RepID=A0AAV4M347_BABCB
MAHNRYGRRRLLQEVADRKRVPAEERRRQVRDAVSTVDDGALLQHETELLQSKGQVRVAALSTSPGDLTRPGVVDVVAVGPGRGVQNDTPSDVLRYLRVDPDEEEHGVTQVLLHVGGQNGTAAVVGVHVGRGVRGGVRLARGLIQPEFAPHDGMGARWGGSGTEQVTHQTFLAQGQQASVRPQTGLGDLTKQAAPEHLWLEDDLDGAAKVEVAVPVLIRPDRMRQPVPAVMHHNGTFVTRDV